MFVARDNKLTPRVRAEVSESVFLGVVWTFVALSLIFLCARCLIKIKTFKRIAPDDLVAIAAWLMFLADVSLWTNMSPRLYANYAMMQGKGPTSEAEATATLDRYGYFIHLVAPFKILFYTSLWTVKLSMLLFFRRLGHQIRSHEVWWWCVLVVTVATWMVCIADIDYPCTTSKPWPWIIKNCPYQSKLDYQNATFYANCALDIISDFLIISIPVLILWNTRVPLRRKLVLILIFSATMVVMVVSVIRVTVVQSEHQSAEIAWLFFWSYVEVGTAIMISCVASFRQLFVAQERATSASKPSPSSSVFERFKKSNRWRSTSYAEEGSEKSGQSLDSGRSGQNIFSPHSIQVHSMVRVSSNTAASASTRSEHAEYHQGV